MVLKDIYNDVLEKAEKHLKASGFEKDSNKEFKESIYNIFDFYKFYSSKYMSYYDYIISNVLILEGDAGTGKTHLLSRIVDKHKDGSDLYFFIIGNKVINSSNPSDSLIEYYNLKDISFFDLIDSYEYYCMSKKLNCFIVFDAINEVKHYSEWNKYISELLMRFEKYKYLKIVLSIRTSFINSIFDEIIVKKITDNKIIKISHRGFTKPKEIEQFMKYYGIKYNWKETNIWLRNPLYLKMYCEVNRDIVEEKIEKNPLRVFELFIQKEERRIRVDLNMNPNISISMSIISKIAKYMYDSNKSSVLYSDFPSLFGVGTEELMIAQEFVKNEVLISTMHEEQEVVSFCYQKIYDNSIIRHLLDNFKKYDDLINELKQKLLHENLNEEFFGVLSQLFSKYREEQNKEILCELYSNCDDKKKKKLAYAYIESLSSCNKIIDYDLFFEIMLGYGNESFDTLFEMLINNIENENLNIGPLHKKLIEKEMFEIDTVWTINVNNSFYYERDVAEYFEKIYNKLVTKNKFEQLSLLVWFLSSSCRELRDKATKTIALNLIDDYKTIIELLSAFINVKDMYVKERLFAAVYGAIMNSSNNYNYKKEAKQICEFIYKHVFCELENNVDILLRDYCSNIIFELKEKYRFMFKNKKIYPRFKDKEKIIDIPIYEIKEMYGIDKEKYGTGLSFIFYSMHPNLNFEDGAGHMYGDFGRYVFEMKLSDFFRKQRFGKPLKINKDLGKIFKYAYYIIVNKFKYNNDLFSEYDKNVRSGFMDRSTHSIERIGKKYEWLAMHYLLALVTSYYDYSENYTDFKTNKYYGAWRPRVRDIDPTFLLSKTERIYDLDFSLNEEDFNYWDINNDSWYSNNDNSFKYVENACLKDSNMDDWICLFRGKTYSSSEDYNDKNQSLWSEISCCLLKKKDKKTFIEELRESSFYGRWATPSQGLSSYTVFLREFPNSRAFKYEFDCKFEPLEIQVGNKKSVQTAPIVKGDLITFGKREFNKPIYAKSKKIKSTYVSYTWESLEDFSILENPSVNMPIGDIVNKLELSMKKVGIWYDKNNSIVCADFRYINNSNEDGLYIKKKYLDLYLKKNKLDIIWICLGEKIQRDGYNVLGFNELSSLIYYDEKGQLQSINHSKP